MPDGPGTWSISAHADSGAATCASVIGSVEPTTMQTGCGSDGNAIVDPNPITLASACAMPRAPTSRAPAGDASRTPEILARASDPSISRDRVERPARPPGTALNLRSRPIAPES